MPRICPRSWAALLGACFVFLIWFSASPGFAQGRLYRIVPEDSSLIVHSDVTGLFKKFGRQIDIEVREFGGEIRFDPDSGKNSSLNFEVKTHSLAVKSQVTDQERENIEMRMHEKMLETERYPDIQYKSEKVKVWKVGTDQYDVEILGRLQLHGQSVLLPLRGRVTVKDKGLEITGLATLKQTKFKIKPYAYQGGALRVVDEVKLSFRMIAQP